ncbi:uncharacterized protein [Eucyclogobius newberryi]|uniref:uncharacterized protein n=1 Tax=Eucyclogobius newberryi TaxID=166745 RepID=UPI003B5C5341
MFGLSSPSPVPPLSPSSPDPPQTRRSSQNPPPSSPAPCWATQARCDLAQAETELRQQHDRYKAEIDSVKRGVERAILGARREERRLVERVEQDHRDAQRHFEQVQHENLAAIRVSQSLLEERLSKLAKLQKQIQDGGQGGVNQNVLLKEVSEFLQPWEISVSIKKVNFKPSSLPNAVSFGDIRVQEQNLCLRVGGCGPKGQMCAIHSQEIQNNDNFAHQATTEEVKGQGRSSSTGRVAKKISITTETQPTPTPPWKYEQSEVESAQDEELESGDDVFLAVPKLLQNLDADANANAKPKTPRPNGARFSPRNRRKASVSPERTELAQSRSFDCQDSNGGKLSPDSRLVKYNSALASPRISPREPLFSQSCLDLTSRGRPHSCLSQSSDEHSLATLCDSGRALSPTDSLDSSYTFIVSSASELSKSSLNYNRRLSQSAVDLSRKTQPICKLDERENEWKSSGGGYGPMSGNATIGPSATRSGRFAEFGQRSLCGSQQRKSPSPQPLVSRSLSMSVIDGSSDGGGRREKGQPALREMEEDEGEGFGGFERTGVRLVRQFGKQGSGRSDMTLPSGIHATPQGQLFVVDCGNSRIQVTDARGNVLQQIGSSSPPASRRCRNYFDIAVNSKGLVALSCAAERALLVYSRHGRLLQTYGGAGQNSARDQLEAPRGVTVTRSDEFLVADVRKGTLIALKLEAKTACRFERTVVTGFHRPYLVAACLISGLVAVSERGSETGRVPCVKILAPDWNTIRVLGVCAGMGPVLLSPWGLCIDRDGDVLVADWAEQSHRIVAYPSSGVGRPVITEGLSSPRGLTILPEGHLAVSDSMHHCVKIFRYKDNRD